MWFSQKLKYLIKSKKRVHQFYKRFNSLNFYHEFSFLRSECKNLKNHDYLVYINKIQDKINTNPKYFWKYFKDKNRSSQLPKSMFYSIMIAENGDDIMKLFKTYFLGVYT